MLRVFMHGMLVHYTAYIIGQGNTILLTHANVDIPIFASVLFRLVILIAYSLD